MVFQVLNCRKIKDDLHLKNVLKHNSRESVTGSEEWLNPDWVPDGLHDVSQTYAEAWAAREEALKGLTRKPQKNAAAAMEIFVSAGEGFSGDWKSYFQDALEFLAQKFGKENLIASAVHTDETTPHLHAIFVPVINTAKGRTYSSANFFGGRKGLARLQTEFARFVGNKHGLVAFELDVCVSLHTCAGRDKLTDDNVLLKADKRVHLALDSGVGENPCGLLERSG